MPPPDWSSRASRCPDLASRYLRLKFHKLKTVRVIKNPNRIHPSRFTIRPSLEPGFLHVCMLLQLTSARCTQLPNLYLAQSSNPLSFFTFSNSWYHSLLLFDTLFHYYHFFFYRVKIHLRLGFNNAFYL